MKGKFYIVLILASLMIASCDIKDVDFVSGSLYLIERKPNDQWGGIFYLSESRLTAKRQTVSLKVGKDLTFVNDTGKEIPVLSYSLYEEPEFIDYPETWTYQDSVFSVTLIKDVVYASALGYWVSYPDTGGVYQDIFEAKQQELDKDKKELALTMDIYLPNDSNRVSRPLLVFMEVLCLMEIRQTWDSQNGGTILQVWAM